MKISVTQPELNYLACRILPMLRERSKIEIHRAQGDGYVLRVDDDTAEGLVDACMKLFSQTGLMDNNEPNADGIFLEALADKFNPAS